MKKGKGRKGEGEGVVIFLMLTRSLTSAYLFEIHDLAVAVAGV